jgi:hypothetical protein
LTFTPDLDIIVAPLLVVIADVIIYWIVGRLGKRSSGTGTKYEPFTGGEENIPKRGVYESELFVFAALFMIVEAFTLILAGSYFASSSFYPLLFLVGGSGVIMLTIWWFLIQGGGRL